MILFSLFTHYLFLYFREEIGKCYGEFGNIIYVTDCSIISKGKVYPITGNAIFTVAFKALVFLPYRGEILDTTVEIIEQERVIVRAGPQLITIPKRVLFIYSYICFRLLLKLALNMIQINGFILAITNIKRLKKIVKYVLKLYKSFHRHKKLYH